MAAFTRYFGEVAALGKPSKIATPGKRPVVKAAAKKAPAKKAKPVVKAKPAKKGTKKK